MDVKIIRKYKASLFILVFIYFFLFFIPFQNSINKTSYFSAFRNIRQVDNLASKELLQNIIQKIKQREASNIKKIASKNRLGLDKDFIYNTRYFLYHGDAILFYKDSPLGIIKQVNEKLEKLDKISKTLPIYSIPSSKKELIHKLFSKLKGNSYEIVKPYYKNPRKKMFWGARAAEPSSIKVLDRQEKPIRQLSIKWLSKLNFEKGSLYDPMCSSGAYLEVVQKEFPKAKLYGSDIAKGMVKRAEERLIDSKNVNIFHRDAADEEIPKILPPKVDVIIFRGLNGRVTNREEAKEIFKKHISLLKPGSNVFVFGVTDVLLSSNFFTKNNFKILNKSSYNKRMESRALGRGGFFQFYVLRYKGR